MPYFFELLFCMIVMVFSLLFGPILLTALTLIALPFVAGPITYWCIQECITLCKCLKRNRMIIIVMSVLFYPLTISITLVLGAILLALYYAILPFFMIIFACHFMYYKCLKSRSVKNKKSLEQLMQR